MRPEGCQETGHVRPPQQHSPQPTDFKPFLATDRLTLSESGTYTHAMTNRRLLAAAFSVAACALAWNSSLGAQTDPTRDVRQRGQRRRRPGSRPRPLRFHRPRRQRRARSAQGRAGRRSDADRCCSSTPARARATTSRTSRTALPGFVKTLTTGDVKNEVAIIAIGERPTVFTNYTFNQAELKKGIDRIWSIQGSGRVPPRRHHRDLPGLQEARGAAPGDRRHPQRGAGVEQPPARSGARSAASRRRGLSRDHAWAGPRAASATKRGTATWSSTRVRGRAAEGARNC